MPTQLVTVCRSGKSHTAAPKAPRLHLYCDGLTGCPSIAREAHACIHAISPSFAMLYPVQGVTPEACCLPAWMQTGYHEQCRDGVDADGFLVLAGAEDPQAQLTRQGKKSMRCLLIALLWWPWHGLYAAAIAYIHHHCISQNNLTPFVLWQNHTTEPHGCQPPRERGVNLQLS